MVIRLPVLGVAALLFAGNCLAAETCTKGSEYEPPLCPLKIPKIAKITIEQNAAKSSAQQEAVSCDGFKVSQRIVRRYFAKAKATNENDAHHTLDWSPCYASGKLGFEARSKLEA